MIILISLLGTGEKFWVRRDAVAIVEISGLIRDSRDVVKQIKGFSKAPRVKAIVIRIDSPGGVVAPTQEIFEEIKEAKTKGKKVVASMGSMATSGGLYIALPCDKIVANPGTITGSIGVIMNFPVLEKLLQKLGITFEIIKSEEYKDIGSPFRIMKSKEKELLKEVVDDVYQGFLEKIVEERKIPWAEVKKIADGRIFTGRQAKEFGLVDTLGGLETAIKISALISGIKEEPKVIRESKFLHLRLILNNLFNKFFIPELLYL
ncbi:MAG: signal peptide peptidase SppA [candidate division WOR-3 bacterium]